MAVLHKRPAWVFPEVALRVLNMIDDGTASLHTVGAAVRRDPVLTAEVLRVANSPLYGARREIETPEQAAAMLGADRLCRIVVNAALRATARRVPLDPALTRTIWRHSLATAETARWVARRRGDAGESLAYFTGRLHDIGMLALADEKPREYSALLSEPPRWPREFSLRERAVVGRDHCRAGAELLQAMGLPGAYAAVAERHHETASGKPILDCARGAVIAADAFGYGFFPEQPIELAASEAGLGPEAVEDLLACRGRVEALINADSW